MRPGVRALSPGGAAAGVNLLPGSHPAGTARARLHVGTLHPPDESSLLESPGSSLPVIADPP